MKTTTFKFDDKTMKLLEELKERTSATSSSEVIRMALRVTDKLTEAAHENDEKIILRKEEESGETTEREVLLP